MADTYNVNVTLDDFNSFITSEKVVDENNQELNDYVCNVTYTNLQNGQINAIGAAIKKAIEDNLPEVALSGSYKDLYDKPSIPTKVSELSNDSEYLIEETDPVFNASPAASITKEDIANWNNNQFIFYFNKFIYEWNDEIEDYETISDEQQTKLNYCGFVTTWINNIDNLYDINNNISSIKNLKTSLLELFEYFNNNILCYLQILNKKLFITDISVNYDDESQINNMTISTVPFSTNNFDTFLKDNIINNETDINNNLDQCSINMAINNIIIDFNNNIIYSIRKIIYPLIAANNGIFINNNGGIGLQLSNKSDNQLSILDTIDEQGLYV